MSAPDPDTVHAPFDAPAFPAIGTAPMSACDQPVGSPPGGGGGGGGGGGADVDTLTLSNVAAAFVPLTWLDTARPTSTFVGIESVLVPTCVQVEPSGDSKPVITLPARTSFTQRGAVESEPVVPTVRPPSERRRWKLTPFADDDATSMKPCADEADSDVRIMTPAFVHALIAWMLLTRATIVPSPLSEVYA